MKRSRLLFMFCGGLAIGSQGFADSSIASDINVSHPNAGVQNFYAGATLGLANYDVMDDSDTAFNVFAGFSVNDVLSVELGWANLGEVEKNTVSTETSAFHLSAVGNFSLQSDIDFYAKLGLASWDVDWKSNWDSDSDSGSDVFFGLGIDYQVGASSSARFGADWYSLDDEDVAVYSIGIKQKF